MKHGGRQSCGNLTHYSGFGGAPRDFITSNTNAIMPTHVSYQINGTGRDSYIAMNNGGNYALHTVQVQAQPGTMSRDRSGVAYPQQLPAKNVVYQRNGTGRDSYIYNSNGGFFASLPVAAYQETFVNKLRSYGKNDTYQPKKTNSQRRGVFVKVNAKAEIGKFKDVKMKKMKSVLAMRRNKSEHIFDPEAVQQETQENNYVFDQKQKETEPTVSRTSSYVMKNNIQTSSTMLLSNILRKQNDQDMMGSSQVKTRRSMVSLNRKLDKSLSLTKIQNEVSPHRDCLPRNTLQISNYQFDLDSRLSQPKRQTNPFIGNSAFTNQKSLCPNSSQSGRNLTAKTIEHGDISQDNTAAQTEGDIWTATKPPQRSSGMKININRNIASINKRAQTASGYGLRPKIPVKQRQIIESHFGVQPKENTIVFENDHGAKSILLKKGVKSTLDSIRQQKEHRRQMSAERYLANEKSSSMQIKKRAVVTAKSLRSTQKFLN